MRLDDADKLVALEMVGGLTGAAASNIIRTAAVREVSRATVAAKAKQAALSSFFVKAASPGVKGLGQAVTKPAA